MKFTDDEFNKIQDYFPDLYLNTEKTKILGELSFSTIFDGKRLQLNPGNEHKHEYFTGYYEIEIRLFSFDRYKLPKVYETSGRILNFAQKNHIRPVDLHLNGDGSCCLGIFTPGESKNMTLYNYVIEYIFSFFAWQAYLKTFGEKPPWEVYSHDQRGFIEKIEDLQAQMELTGRNDPCPCGSGKKYKICCMESHNLYQQRKH